MNFNYHKNIEYISVNRYQDRNFYCPKSVDDEPTVYKSGSRFISLNGTWLFKYYDKNCNYSHEDSLEEIIVPSCWQISGYGKTCYVNDHYLIDVKPPFVDDSNYGVYKKIVTLNIEKNKKYYLNFEGKDSCLYLYINGEFVGFDSVSHNTSEFEVTRFLHDGENELIVFVYETCVGTYFECQDKFRLSGLFRDVYLLIREEEHIHSYNVFVKKEEESAIVTLTFSSPKLNKNIKIFDANNILVTELSTYDDETVFKIENPILWNTENPYLYMMQIECNNEFIYDYLGIRFVEIKNNVLELNGQNIKLLGVNRHESSYKTGYYLSLEEQKKDLLLLKEHNFNAIRTSHYPSSPEFMYLCDELGFYVIDEADIECHGILYLNGEYDINNFDQITNNLIFKDILFDRVNRMIIRDFNRCSVISWSAGNEAGYGSQMIEVLKYMKQRDLSRFVHYESTYTASPKTNNYKLDVISQMYSSYEKILETLSTDERPLVLCEFSHSMGNSCGDIHDYVELFYSNDRIMGGFIWEFNDHLVPINQNINKPGYGGDFGEPLHSGNFCVDGIVTKDRTPHTSMLEIKAAYSNLQIVKRNSSYYLCNRFDFTPINEDCYVMITIEDFKGYKEEKNILICNLAPHEGTKLIDFESEDYVITFNIYHNDKLYQKVSFIGDNYKYVKKQFEPKILSAIEDDEFIYLKNDDVLTIVSKEDAMIKSIIKKDEVLLGKATFNLLRAPLDNDMYEVWKWEKWGLFDFTLKVISYTVKDNELEFSVVCSSENNNILNGKIIYKISNGSILIETLVDVSQNVDYLPRLGYSFQLENKYKDYSYLGFGPHESYVDKHYLDTYNFYNAIINDDCEYVKPQEYKSHLASYLSLEKLRFHGMKSFSYLPYSLKELISKKHNYELDKDDYNYLSLDYMMTGIGSHSCGPELLDKYKLIDKKIKFELIVEVK